MLFHLMATAQPLCTVTRYDETDGVSSSHLTQLLQDEQGFMWFATWNGLCRFDGYEFQTFKPQVGDGCHMLTDRIRNITLLPANQILCQVDNDYFMFDLSTYRFRDLTNDERMQVKENELKYRQSRSLLNRDCYEWADAYVTQWQLRSDGQLTYQQDGRETVYPLPTPMKALTFATQDNQGNLWAVDYGSIYRFTTGKQSTQRLLIEPSSEVKCLFADSRGHYFVTTKDDKTVRVYDSKDDRLLGFLGSDGRLHQAYTSFGAAVYCMHESNDGTLWLGTKPDGLYRLQPIGDEMYKIGHFTDIPQTDIYHIAEDRWGRLWLATLDGGICYATCPTANQPHFNVPRQYPDKDAPRARYIFITENDVMLIATSTGLIVAKMERDAEKMRFQRHQREPERSNSLSCSATMDVVQDLQGRYYVSTESGGVNQIEGSDLLAPVLDFRHFNEQFHVQGNDVVQSLVATADGGLVAVGSRLVTMIDSTGQGRVFDAHYFNQDYRFSEAHPLQLKDGRWFFGLMDGAFVTTSDKIQHHARSPRLVLTSLAVKGEQQEPGSSWAAEHLDTLTLQPHERSLTVHFAALDFDGAGRISYAFRLSGNDDWSYIGKDRSATLLDLEPGTYLLEIRSTNADGVWQDNIRQLTIIVKPTFWESVWGRLLLLLLVFGTIAAVARTFFYIKHIKQQQHETLEKYLALIERKGGPLHDGTASAEETATAAKELDPVIRRVMQFVEENLSNSDAGVGEMAQAAAVSRSGLQRKLKQAMGITPLDLLREARIKHACQLLRQTDKTVSDIAYACGFTDPKYFGRCFKQSTGMSPSEYKNN